VFPTEPLQQELVWNRERPAVNFNEPFLLHPAERTRDHLTHGAYARGNLLIRKHEVESQPALASKSTVPCFRK
jgi:hypothetical protein